MQDDAFDNLYSLIEKINNINNPDIQRDWRYLQTSDHFYYMCTKWFSDGDVHKYFNPYDSPYDAFITFMNVFSDFKLRVDTVDSITNKIKSEKPVDEEVDIMIEEYEKKLKELKQLRQKAKSKTVSKQKVASKEKPKPKVKPTAKKTAQTKATSKKRDKN
jgi:alpha-amylase